MTKKPTTAIASAEAELAGLQKRRASLQERHDRAVDALNKAKAARRSLLVEADEPDTKALAASDRACRDAQDAAEAANDASAEIDQRIETLSTEIAKLIDAEQRGQRAADMEASATAAEAAVERIRKAAKEIEAAHKALADAIGPAAALYNPPTTDPERSYKSYLGTTWHTTHGDRSFTDVLTPEQVADRMTGHILAPVLSSCVVTTEAELAKSNVPTRVGLRPLNVAADIRDALTTPIRNHAAALRDGAAPLLPLAIPMSRSEIAKSTGRPLPSIYKISPEGQRLDIEGNPLDQTEAEEIDADEVAA